MNDLVERLRRGVRRADFTPADNNAAERALAREAADALKALRAENERLKAGLEAVKQDCLDRAVDGVVPLGESVWLEICAALKGELK